MQTKNIPFFNLSRQHEKYKKNLNKKINEILESQAFIGGNFVANFEKNFAKYLNVNHAISCNSGTDSLWMALKALGLKQNEIVLTTPFSFIASSSEIIAHGAHAVFVDIDSQTYNIDPKKIKAWIKSKCSIENNTLIHKETGYKVVGILPVDIFGQCADYSELRQIANQYNLWIVQDSCQAVGAVDNQNVFAGNQGDITCFSFYPTKNLGAYGDGGMLTTNNPILATKLMRIRNHGRESHYNYIEYGINSRLDGIQAAILNEKLNYLDNFNSKRIEFASIYNETLKDLNNIKIPKAINGKHIYHQYAIELINVNRDKVIDRLKTKGIGYNIYYPKGLNQIEFLNNDKRLKSECPISDNLTKNVLALPIWPELETKEVKYIANTLKEILEQQNINFLNQKEQNLNI